MNNNYLEHYGVKGMKWGVRKQRQTSKKMKIDAYSSAGYSSDGTRSYTDHGPNKEIMKRAKRQSSTYMTKYFGEKWVKDSKNQEIFDTVLSEMYMELESKGKYKSPYL